MTIKKILKIALLVFIVAIIVIQFFRPDRLHTDEITQDHIIRKMNVPDSALSILKRSCYDCHSNHTTWPWYSNISPVSWLVADDVKEGRKKMNFSEWGKLSQSKQVLRLESICEQIKEGEMPLPNYLIIHTNAVLTEHDKEILCQWSEKEKQKLESE
jgi:heme-binding protein